MTKLDDLKRELADAERAYAEACAGESAATTEVKRADAAFLASKGTAETRLALREARERLVDRQDDVRLHDQLVTDARAAVDAAQREHDLEKRDVLIAMVHGFHADAGPALAELERLDIEMLRALQPFYQAVARRNAAVTEAKRLDLTHGEHRAHMLKAMTPREALLLVGVALAENRKLHGVADRDRERDTRWLATLQDHGLDLKNAMRLLNDWAIDMSGLLPRPVPEPAFGFEGRDDWQAHARALRDEPALAATGTDDTSTNGDD